MGMAGSAYLVGLGQANFEINAIVGVLIAAFVFVPLYLRARVTTIIEYFEMRFGTRVALTYSILMMVLIIIVPAIALAGITENALADTPDQAYMVMINTLLPTGLRGVILCGLFASLMSTVDSTFNSVSTLWSIDVYKRHLAPEATDAQVVAMGKKAILGTLVTGVIFGFFMIYVKLGNEDFPLTHWFNALSYVVKSAFVVLIVAAVFLFRPVVDKVPDAVPTEDGLSPNLVFGTMMLTIPLTAAVWWMPELANALLGVEIAPMNYLVRSMWVILVGCGIVALPTWRNLGFRFTVKIESSGKGVSRFGWALGASLVICHISLPLMA